MGIKEVYQINTELMRMLDRAQIYFRAGEYLKALGITVEAVENLKKVSDIIISNIDYFEGITSDMVIELLAGIVDAKKKKDYVLLADLFEMQIIPFLGAVQETIIKKDDPVVFDSESYTKNKELIKLKLRESLEMQEIEGDNTELRIINQNASLDEEIVPEKLLRDGYRVEFTTSGLMTLAARGPNDNSIYMHTNHRVTQEAFLLANRWYEPAKETYVIYGLGMGYHIKELLRLADLARIEIYESDMNIIKLTCAFSEVEELCRDKGVALYYDPDFELIEKRLRTVKPSEKVCIHYPSLCKIKNKKAGDMLRMQIPWAKIVDEC